MNVVCPCTLEAEAYTLDITLSSEADLNWNSLHTSCPFGMIKVLFVCAEVIAKDLEMCNLVVSTK